MDSRTPATGAPSADAAEFVRFCYRRRRVGWPDLYDEMCAVGSRGLFRGWGIAELGDHGIGFSLFAMPTLAALVAEVIAEEQANAPKRAGFSIGRLTGSRHEHAPAVVGDDDREARDARDAQAERAPALVPLGAR